MGSVGAEPVTQEGTSSRVINPFFVPSAPLLLSSIYSAHATLSQASLHVDSVAAEKLLFKTVGMSSHTSPLPSWNKTVLLLQGWQEYQV